MKPLRSVGYFVIRHAAETMYALAYFGNLLLETLKFPRKKQIAFRVLVMQIFFTGVEALGTIAFLAMGIGAVIIIQGTALLPQFGQLDLLYTILILVIVRELGPLLTAFIITARSGSAITTELGNMAVSHEVEAYIAVGINPISYLGVPRLIGVTTAMLLLNIYFVIAGLMGSFLVAQVFHTLPFFEYVMKLAETLRPWDLISSLTKSLVFGIIISTVATYYGFKVTQAVTEVPQKTIKSIGVSIVLCIIAGAFMTSISYAVGG